MAGPVLFMRRNALLVLLTLALSWLIWVQVSTFFQETWRGEIPVHKVAVGDGETFILNPDPEWVTVEVYGNRRDLERVRGNLTAEIRIRPESASAGLKTVQFRADDLELPPGLELLSMDPPEVSVTYARFMEDDVAVKAVVDKTSLDKDSDIQLVDAVAWPESIGIDGPEEDGKKVVSTGLQTVSIDPKNYVSALGTDTEYETEIYLDLKRWAGSGLKAPISKVRVRLRYVHVARREEVWVPLEVHWVDPDLEKNAKCFRIEATGGSVEEKGQELKIKIALRGPRSVLDDDELIEKIRAYVRSDEAGTEIKIAPVRFENLPEGVSVVPIQPSHQPTITYEKAYELKRDE
jgi:hypothetical protein